MANSLMSKKLSQTEDKYIVRFPDGMRDRIREEAEKNGRSMNAEIIARLANSFDSDKADGSSQKYTENFASEVADQIAFDLLRKERLAEQLVEMARKAVIAENNKFLKNLRYRVKKKDGD